MATITIAQSGLRDRQLQKAKTAFLLAPSNGTFIQSIKVTKGCITYVYHMDWRCYHQLENYTNQMTQFIESFSEKDDWDRIVITIKSC